MSRIIDSTSKFNRSREAKKKRLEHKIAKHLYRSVQYKKGREKHKETIRKIMKRQIAAGSIAGGLSGAKIDILSGGSTMGLGTAIGTIGGGLTAAASTAVGGLMAKPIYKYGEKYHTNRAKKLAYKYVTKYGDDK